MKPDVWFADCEVFAHDLIWVFKSKRTGELAIFHNDGYAVEEFIESTPNIWLCGYNFRDYDQYILKATLMGWDNDQLKELNDTLIFGELQDAWSLLGYETVFIPPIIDLFHDIVPRKSLKEIEGNMGMNVVETGVSFDIERPLNSDELRTSIEYCVHDVEATEALYHKRLDYIRTKKTLCDLSYLDDAEMMKNTNARVVAEALRAQPCNPLETFGFERYMDIIPDYIIDIEKLPKKVVDFIEKIDTYSGWHDEIEPILFDCYGVPTIMGIGGIHASTGMIEEHVFKSGPRKGLSEHVAKSIPKTFESNEDYDVIIQDIGSFYPSMMLIFDYISRGVPDEHKHLFEDFYNMRMEAKANGDKETANAAKLVLNTVYGCMKNQYNKLYDPFMATCVCVTGQLLIIDLMRRIQEKVNDVEIVQLNTDGWVLKLPKSQRGKLYCVIEDWKELTGFTVDTDQIKKMVQRDVNNYVIEFDNGKIKAKGGTVKNWQGGDFRSNSATIVDKAIVEYLIHGVPIEDTVNNETDLGRFQIILKAGSTYDGCCKFVYDSRDFISLDGKVHRIYATESGDKFYKYKEGGNPASFPDAPDRATEDFFVKSIDDVDKMWYTAMAKKKLQAFLGEEK